MLPVCSAEKGVAQPVFPTKNGCLHTTPKYVYVSHFSSEHVHTGVTSVYSHTLTLTLLAFTFTLIGDNGFSFYFYVPHYNNACLGGLVG